MSDRRVQVVAILVMLVAIAFGGWGLYEVGKSHGAREAHAVNNAPTAAVPTAQANPAPGSNESASMASAPASGSESDIVHATRTGKRYHREGCRFLSKSDIPMTRAEAEAKGLTPCSVCQP